MALLQAVEVVEHLDVLPVLEELLGQGQEDLGFPLHVVALQRQVLASALDEEVESLATSLAAKATLTIVATIFIPLSFIAGLYGMNFEHMPELHWQYGYILALALMGSVVVGMLAWFRNKGWF